MIYPPKFSLVQVVTFLLLFIIIDVTNSQFPTGHTSSVLSTIPGRNAIITPGTNQITISYAINDIKPSIGYITISQKNTIEGGDDFLRTKIPSNNSKSITIIGSEVRVTLEDYVFDRGNTTYIIKIDDDFVEVNGQNLIGSSWEISTAPGSGNNEPGNTRATILLTPTGTKNYLENRKIYVYEMSKEISKALAIEEGRIFIPYDRYQYKRNTREDQILLRIDIKDAKTSDQLSSFALRYSLDKIIISKDTSTIGTRIEDLDPNYGAPENIVHLWSKYKYILIGVIIGLIILLIIWASVKRKKPEGSNFSTIFFYPLILVDFVLDIVVLGVHGRDLKWFYICGWVFLLVPIFFNIIISWYLINYQLRSSRAFANWWKDHPKTTLGFTLLSLIDLEALNVITSQCAGNEALNAKFTKKGRKKIDNSIVTMAFIEDIPQLIIYALYQRYTVIPDIIPILVLSSACITFLFNIHDRDILRRKELDTNVKSHFSNFFNFFNFFNCFEQKKPMMGKTFNLPSSGEHQNSGVTESNNIDISIH